MNIPFSHKNFFSKQKNDVWFIIVGLILMFVLIWISVVSIQFLSISVNNALDEKNQDASPVSFNLGALEGLGIVQQTPTTSSTPSVLEQ